MPRLGLGEKQMSKCPMMCWRERVGTLEITPEGLGLSWGLTKHLVEHGL